MDTSTTPPSIHQIMDWKRGAGRRHLLQLTTLVTSLADARNHVTIALHQAEISGFTEIEQPLLNLATRIDQLVDRMNSGLTLDFSAITTADSQKGGAA